ncbi:DUF550 domain-containing protein [Salmonella enterica subsp. enterica]|nr:DUF550 domain-containing protein [Salmonella enterica subsp. enterica serovar Hvittingfoss]EDM8922200.1 DUF550 domain-containing protein [Salmonella enterica subsp. enterica serovar Hvittingfoss]
MTTITKEHAQKIIDAADEVITALAGTNDDSHPDNSEKMCGLWDDLNDRYAPPEVVRELARAMLASMDAEPAGYHVIKECGKIGCSVATLEKAEKTRDFWNKKWTIRPYFYSAPPASERERIRREHAEWSDATFGNVGPVGPLKHLSKEALEAAADPSDPLEWADMQFLLWDAQRRMGISDEFITRAMIEKLEINKSRQWPEPKDGEPRLHIKEQPAPVVPPAIEPDYKVIKGILPTANPDEYACCIAADMWNACRAAMLQGVEQPQNARQNIPENIPDGNSPVSPDGWISCSERMPDSKTGVLVAREFGRKGDWRMKWATYIPWHPDTNDGWLIPGASWKPSHWMPLPEPPL